MDKKPNYSLESLNKPLLLLLLLLLILLFIIIIVIIDIGRITKFCNLYVYY